jgi:hypothetical protein
MVRSRIEAAAPVDTELVFPSSRDAFEAQLEPPPDLILVGLTATRLPWAELIQAVRGNLVTHNVPVLAFGPHRDLELRARAIDAGASRVLANSALMQALPGLLRGDTQVWSE